MKDQSPGSTWKENEVPRGKNHNQTETKTTISLYLNRKLVKKARNYRLNLSRITEQALSSILDYMETQNCEKTQILLAKPLLRKMSGGPDRIRTGDLLHVKQMS